MRTPALAGLGLAGVLACAGPPPVTEQPGPEPTPVARGLPPVPAVSGPLALAVVYPPDGATIEVRDSTFLFGSVGTGDAGLTVNGLPVQVSPNGSWLAWVPVPADTLVRFRVAARRGGDSAEVIREVRRPRRFQAPAQGLWVDTTSFRPVGRVWWPAAEPLPLSVRATEGASLTLVLPSGARVPLVAVAALPQVDEAIRAFDRDTMNLVRGPKSDRYIGALSGEVVGAPLGAVLAPVGNGQPGEPAVLEVTRGSDTVRVRWPMRVTLMGRPTLAELDDDPARRGGTDGITVGRATPGGTYHWFFPAGTRASVTGRVNGDVRLGLSSTSAAWVAAAELQPLADGVVPGPAVVGSLTANADQGRARVRVPLSWRVPYQVEEDDRGIRLRLYGTVGDVNWIRYGRTVPMIDRIAWRQAQADEVEVEIRLADPLWGYRLSWNRNDLIVEVRPRPAIDSRRPLAGRRIVIDAGHPPAGAIGPSGLTEAEANLGVARVVRELLEAEGAEVIMTRDDEGPVDLWPRVRLADSLDADLEVSIHNNALPDGVNPFANNGSSVFYFHPRSIPLARSVQAELVARLGLRDLGFARGDLALVRGTWMPSILTEGLFMMMPDQEAALRSDAGRRRYAEAVAAGIRRFLAGSDL